MVICGENYHRIGSLLPPAGEKPKFAQLYIFEPENEMNHRLSNFASCEAQLLPELLTSLLRMLDEHNELVKTFRRVRQQLHDSDTPTLKLRIFGAKSRNRQYDLPTSSDIVALIPGDFIPDRDDRDIIVDPNMRINDSLADEERFLHGYTFPQWVLALGDGCLKTRSFRQDTPADWVQIPQVFLVDHGADPIESLATDIYDSFAENYKNPFYLANRAVVTPTNATVSELNKYMLDHGAVPDPGKTYYSSDSLLQTTETADSFEECYPTEFLNSLTFNGIPDHELTLKIHTPVMLLRNISLGLGLCNGTRVMITSLGNDIIKGTIMGGFGDTDEVIILRIVLNVENPKWPFTLKRRQFPIRLCYGMTINKSQGQTLDKVGIYLPEPVFSHGQLYVGVSRVKSAKGLRILIKNTDDIPNDYTRNIIFREAFADILQA
ncbi:unnamed protein product [Linum tenue]|uniref:DNA helicase Pif1-like 2B domain-containing protein n=2 Tax=Linum tenue TaxID=586396 RepID=A0AAV0NWD3_9ROSI|nr:unnamed protein product [Linum tenue]